MTTWQISYVLGNWMLLAGSRAAVAVQPSVDVHEDGIKRALDDLYDITDLATLARRLREWDPALLVDLLLVGDDKDKVTAVVRGNLKVYDAVSGLVLADGGGGVVWQLVPSNSNRLRIDFEVPAGGTTWAEMESRIVKAAVLEINAGERSIMLPAAQLPVTAALTTAASATAPSMPSTPNASFQLAPVMATPSVAVQVPDDVTQLIPAINSALLFEPTAVGMPQTVVPGAVFNGETAKPVSPTLPVTLPAPWPPAEWTQQSPATAPSTVQLPVVRALLAFSDGRVLPLTGSAVIGRSPQVALNDLATPIKVHSPNRDVSRTHMRIDPQGGAWLVSDLNSTNGTLVRRQGEATVVATGGAPVLVTFGTLIALGDNVVLRIDPLHS
ncbi:MAG: FHA domain-containing protein [Propionibacteriaceae bacterium]|jgi:hypothetical protein|nr:FHA domain-containing protein [Propionibacteriaceae bacterium]